MRLARARNPVCNVAIFNNDLRIGPRLVVRLAAGLRSAPDLWAVSPNYDRRPIQGVQYIRARPLPSPHGGTATTTSWPAFEAQGGRVGIVGDTTVEHIGGGAQSVRYTRDLLTAIERGRRRMWAKWSHF